MDRPLQLLGGKEHCTTQIKTQLLLQHKPAVQAKSGASDADSEASTVAYDSFARDR